MTQFLPPNLLALFAPRDPIQYLPPAAKLPHEKTLPRYAGVAQFMTDFEDPRETPVPTRSETKDEKRERVRREKAEQIAYKLEQDLALWDPHSNPALTEDAFKTLFVARINFDTSESKLRREFEIYGNIKSIRIVHDAVNGKPRGYAFIEYEQERDMHSAYKHADGKKIDSRRVLVDVERARTVKGWRPRRLGGGLGSTRKGKEEEPANKDEPAAPEAVPERKERSRSRERDRKKRSRSPVKRRSRSRERRRSKEREAVPREREVRENRETRENRDTNTNVTERRRSRSRERDRAKRSRRSRSPREKNGEKKRSRSRDRKRSRRSRSKDRKKDKEVKVKTEKLDDGYPVNDNGELSQDGAPQLEEGESQDLNEYPPPESEVNAEDGYGGEYDEYNN